ncbi:MAG TPA: hypothetical protein VFD92_00010 [Candidatus Binatia bacterium]|nr:hypothetical protein [Candidatus Binatia bacterium]
MLERTSMRTIPIDVGDDAIELAIDGDIRCGGPEILLDGDDDLSAHAPWAAGGYTVAPFLARDDYEALRVGVRDVIRRVARERIGRDVPAFDLAAYHEVFSEAEHDAIVVVTRACFAKSWLPIDPAIIERRISEIVGLPLTLDSGHPANVRDFCFRIVRPRRLQDNNPPHRDVYLENIRNCLNLYAPLCGSGPRSALALVPGSHRLSEAEIERTHGPALVNGVRFTVPCITALRGDRVRMVRPDPAENEVLLFSPYLVHGAGYNLGDTATRISLELRFWRKRD